MVRLIAAIVFAMGIWLLFRLNREKEVSTSKALWIPTFWLFIASSRNIGEWLSYDPGGQSDRYREGNPLDRAFLSIILARGLSVVIRRVRQVGALLRSNIPILMYFLYCGISILWSDFPDVSFKRWFRALGDVAMILIVLSDLDWLAAIRRLFARVGFVVVPVSILCIRYFPELGRAYSRGGRSSWTGVGTDKNALGMICLVFGLAAIFRFLQLRKDEGDARKKGPLFAQGSLILMVLYLLWRVNSCTSVSCFFVAGGVMLSTHLFPVARKPTVLRLLIATAVIVPLSAMFLGIGSSLVGTLGRDTSFTGRTAIWQAALGMVSNPILGAGYESFWLGQRLVGVENLIRQGVNQAHNGYIEIYLNLGWVGLVLLAILLVTGYRRIFTAVLSETQAGNLRLAFFIVAVAYNFSEGGFKMMHPVWITFLLSIAASPELSIQKAPELGPRRIEAELVAKPVARVRVSVRQNSGNRMPKLVPKKFS